MKPLFNQKLQKKQIKLLEDQEEQIRSVLKVQKRRQEQQEKHFVKFTEEAKEFIVSNLAHILLFLGILVWNRLSRSIVCYG